MNDKILEWAVKIQSIAQAGLTYGHDSYDRERYEHLRHIAAEMVVERADIPVDTVKDLFCNESGYQTPKIDTRAAIFQGGKILLVHEKNGTWSLRRLVRCGSVGGFQCDKGSQGRNRLGCDSR